VSEDITRVTWRKSMRSNGSGNCVEVAQVAGIIAVRDSKNPDGGILRIRQDQWKEFVGGAKAGLFDLS
jgi:hypothetical protein